MKLLSDPSIRRGARSCNLIAFFSIFVCALAMPQGLAAQDADDNRDNSFNITITGDEWTRTNDIPNVAGDIVAAVSGSAFYTTVDLATGFAVKRIGKRLNVPHIAEFDEALRTTSRLFGEANAMGFKKELRSLLPFVDGRTDIEKRADAVLLRPHIIPSYDAYQADKTSVTKQARFAADYLEELKKREQKFAPFRGEGTIGDDAVLDEKISKYNQAASPEHAECLEQNTHFVSYNLEDQLSECERWANEEQNQCKDIEGRISTVKGRMREPLLSLRRRDNFIRETCTNLYPDLQADCLRHWNDGSQWAEDKMNELRPVLAALEAELEKCQQGDEQ